LSERTGRTLQTSGDRFSTCGSALTVESGAEWVVDATGCCSERLASLSTLRAVCEQIIADLKLKVVGEPQWHQFPDPGGVTGLYLLTESHLTCHTYPEYGLATLNLYCCRPQVCWPWQEELRRHLDATAVHIRCLSRGVEAPASVNDEGGPA